MSVLENRVERLERATGGTESWYDPGLPILMRAPTLETCDEALSRHGLAPGTPANWIELVELEARL